MGDCGVSANEYNCAHSQGAQINFGDLTPYLTYGHREPNGTRLRLKDYETATPHQPPASYVGQSLYLSEETLTKRKKEKNVAIITVTDDG